MKLTSLLAGTCCVAAVMAIISCATPHKQPDVISTSDVAREQVPTWSDEDKQFFLHGSMSTEFVPERVLRAFIATYPDLFPTNDFSHAGLIPDPKFGWPIGMSRANVSHLGGMSSVGVNCAACHVAEVRHEGKVVHVLGVTSHFDAEAFFGAIVTATFRTQDPANMKRFLKEYLVPRDGPRTSASYVPIRVVEEHIERQSAQIEAAITADPSGASGAGPGGLHDLSSRAFEFNGYAEVTRADMGELTTSMLKLFHNMRAALHVPDQPPTELPPASGPGRNDAFGLLSAILFQSPQPHAPVKYGVVWNLKNRHWVHWDGNTRSPIARNILASLGLGAPLIEMKGQLNFADVSRQTALTEEIRPATYPFAIDHAAARRGEAHYRAKCASCHDGAETDSRAIAVEQVGTDPTRARSFSPGQAAKFNAFLATVVIDGYTPPTEPGLRSTQKYWSPTLDGVWARSPYLHNGSVRTMAELLMKPSERPTTFHRGSKSFDAKDVGYTDDGAYVFDATKPGNLNIGHDYGTDLSRDQKRDLIEYLKTR